MVYLFLPERTTGSSSFFFKRRIKQSLIPVLSNTLNKNQRVSWKNRKFFKCFVYFWESQFIHRNQFFQYLRTNQWASEHIPELITDRYLSFFLRTTQHWCLRSLSLFHTLGGLSMFSISLWNVFLERPSCFVQHEPNMLAWVHWDFQSFDQLFWPSLFPRSSLIISSLKLVGKNYKYVLFAGKIKLTLSSHPIRHKVN
jgi:hypothetical protein